MKERRKPKKEQPKHGPHISEYQREEQGKRQDQNECHHNQENKHPHKWGSS